MSRFLDCGRSQTAPTENDTSSEKACRREQSTDTVAALASAAAEHLVTKCAFSGSLMEWHRHRTLHSPDQPYRQRGRLSERSLQSSHSRTNHLEQFGSSTHGRATHRGRHAPVSWLSRYKSHSG